MLPFRNSFNGGTRIKILPLIYIKCWKTFVAQLTWIFCSELWWRVSGVNGWIF